MNQTLQHGMFKDWSLAGDWQRKLSLAVAIAYLIIWPIVFPSRSLSYLMADMLIRILGLAFPLACIWFGDDLGEYYRNGSLYPEITTPSAGKYVTIGGWVLLLLPVWSYLLVRVLVYFYVR